MATYYQELYDAVLETTTINTHSHHLADDAFAGFDLDQLLAHSYLGWGDATLKLEPTTASRKNFLEKLKFTQFFRCLQKSIQEISLENWEAYSRIISQRYQTPQWQMQLLKEKCKYEKIILDTYWEPGLDHGHPDIYAPSFRIDPAFFGFDKNLLDHDGYNLFSHYGKEFTDIDGLMDFVYAQIKTHVNSGAVAIKNAGAYDRGLDYEPATKSQAARVFQTWSYTAEDVVHFQNYFFDAVCKIAGELDVPVQCHTGMGCYVKTRAANLLNVIRNNPKTKFSILHCSYPWSSDIGVYIFQFDNVYFDTVWVPTISPTKAEFLFHQMIESMKADRVTWGCDTWTSEDSYAAKLAMADVLARVLAEKVERGYFSLRDAYEIIHRYMYDNAKTLFKL